MAEAETPDAAPENNHVFITTDLRHGLTIVDYDNGVRLLQSLRVINQSTKGLTEVTLRLQSTPPVFSKSWVIDSIDAGTSHAVSDLSITVDPIVLRKLTERERVSIEISLESSSNILATSVSETELLPRNHWTGLAGGVPELVAAYSPPNNPSIDIILRSASDLLETNGRSASLNGYDEGSTHAWEIANAIWNAVARLSFKYIFPASSFEQTGQKIRTPDAMMQSRMGTCLDLALLFTALLEQASLHPVIVFTQGHAFPGFWTTAQSAQSTVCNDPSQLRTSIQLKRLVLFESTLLTGSTFVPFSDSIRQGTANIALERDNEFVLAVDIHQARSAGIRPLASLDLSDSTQAAKVGTPDSELTLEAPPDVFGSVGNNEEEEERPTTPGGRIDRWQKKLLDMSLRNRLINFRPSNKTLEICVSQASALEDAIAKGSRLSFAETPTAQQQARTKGQARLPQTSVEETTNALVAQELANRKLLVNKPMEEIEATLLQLFRTTKTGNEEGGTNTLFIALGFLKWLESPSSTTPRFAPLLLVPVTLDRATARSGFTLRAHDDDLRFNPTLIQKLAQDSHITLPFNYLELERDESGIDVDQVFRKVREAIHHQRGWEVVETAQLASFSFSKYLMWKDLVDRSDQLKHNIVVNQLLEGRTEGFPDQGEFPDEHRMDVKFPVDQVFAPLPADSTQLATVLAAHEGKSFVVIGPPGTGKSQTIANIITQTLASGKTVLFVSEKIAALDVVHRRLREAGLGDLCLELHSNKANKKNVLQQLAESWSSSGYFDDAKWASKAHELQGLRSRLNQYVTQLHHVHPNGLKFFDAFGTISANKDVPKLALDHQRVVASDQDAYMKLKSVASRIQDTAERLPAGAHSHPLLRLIGEDHWSYSFQDRALEAASDLNALVQKGAATIHAFHSHLGFSTLPLTFETVSATATLANHLLGMPEHVLRGLTEPNADMRLDQLVRATELAVEIDQIDRALSTMWETTGSGAPSSELLAALREAVRSLSVPYSAEVESLDLGSIRTEWAKAEARLFFTRGRAKAKVQKTLASGTLNQQMPNMKQDLDTLVEVYRHRDSLKDRRGKLEGQLRALPDMSIQANGVWQGASTNLDSVHWSRSLIRNLDSVIRILEPSVAATVRAEMGRSIAASGSPRIELMSLARSVSTTAPQISQMRDHLLDILGTPASLRSELDTQSLEDIDSMSANLGRIADDMRSWCLWLQARKAGVEQGLSELITRIETNQLPAGVATLCVDVNFQRTWVRYTLDNYPMLRDFTAEDHEQQIRLFRDTDDAYAKITSEIVRNRARARSVSKYDGGRKSEGGILRHEIQKKTRHKPIRQLLGEAPHIVTHIAPCFMMSPLSIAQYLPANSSLFDVVVFDEASQIPVYDAVGAIARGRQVIMVGDQKQLPPTSFFNRTDNDEEIEDDLIDLESILDECVGSSMPKRSLNWHYRSRHESLIAFSNRRYYGNKLVTFPSPVTADTAVSSIWVPGIYEPGSGESGRTNKLEAECVVKEIIAQLKEHPDQSVGVVTFNEPQKRLIEDYLDKVRVADSSLEYYFSSDRLEPVMVKALEQVQGDERDVMFFSTTYGRNPAGNLSMNFGPLNKTGGERRLNVAITRARYRLVVITSLRPEDIDLRRTAAAGVADFKLFLDYANRGMAAINAEATASHGGADSPFETSVADALMARGWDIHLQVGVSGYRIDIAVVDPDASGAYLAGIECDGATYHSSATARDRDKIRESVLRGLGWEILRVWSTDWYQAETKVLDRLDTTLHELRDSSRAIRLAEADRNSKTESVIDVTENTGDDGPSEDSLDSAWTGGSRTPTVPDRIIARNSSTTTTASNNPLNPQPQNSSEQSGSDANQTSWRTIFRRADLRGFAQPLSAPLFYERSYDNTLKALISHIVKNEGPIREDALITTVRDWHGFGRAGGTIRNRILDLIPNTVYPEIETDGTVFYWPRKLNTAEKPPFRKADTPADRREAADIPMQELVSLAIEARRSGREDERAIDFMREAIGIMRLSTKVRIRLEEALRLARQQGQ